ISSHGLGFVGARVRLASSANRVTLNTSAPAIVFDTEDFDTDGFFNSGTSTTRFYIPSGKAGYYTVGSSILTGQNTAGTVRSIRVRKNGSEICSSSIHIPAGDNNLYQLACTTIHYFAVGD